MRSRIRWVAAAAGLVLACSPGPEDAKDTLEPGVCGDGELNLGEACDVPGDPGCDDACHLTDAIVWTVTRGEPGVFLTYPLDVAVGADGRIAVLGYRWGGGGLPEDGEGWLLALDPAGEVLWEKPVQTPFAGESVHPVRVAIGIDGSIYYQGFDLFSYAADGELRWTVASPTFDPGPGETRLRSNTAFGVAGDAVITASFGVRTLDPDGPSMADGSLRRHDPATGELLWERLLTGGTAVAYASEVAVVDSTVIAAGPASPGDHEAGYAFACADVDTGALVPCLAGAYATVEHLTALPAGDVLLVGSADAQEFVRRVDLTGEVAWTLPITAEIGKIRDVAAGPDGTIVLVGSRGDHDMQSAALRALDDTGRTAWDLVIGPQGDETSVGALAVAFGPGFLVVAGATDIPGAITIPWVRRFGPAT